MSHKSKRTQRSSRAILNASSNRGHLAKSRHRALFLEPLEPRFTLSGLSEGTLYIADDDTGYSNYVEVIVRAAHDGYIVLNNGTVVGEIGEAELVHRIVVYSAPHVRRIDFSKVDKSAFPNLDQLTFGDDPFSTSRGGLEILGSTGSEVIIGSPTIGNLVSGGGGDDRIVGGREVHVISGGKGHDNISGLDGND